MSRRPPPPPPASRVDVPVAGRQPRILEPEDLERQGHRVKPFRLDDLERYTQEIAAIHRAIHSILPEGAFELGFLGRVRQVLQECSQMDVDLWFHSIRVLKRNQLRAIIPGTAFLGIIGLAPLAEKILIEVDMRFVYRAIDQLLGGRGVAVDVHRPLTEIEQGVFSFLALKILQLFSDVVNPEQVALRLEDVRTDIRSAADIFRNEEHWICVAWKMNFDLDVGYIRALVPQSLARHVGLDRLPEDPARAERYLARMRSRMDRLSGVIVEAPVVIGRIDLSVADLEALDLGDIILLEETQVGFTEHGVAGPAVMTIGRGERGAIHGEVGAQEFEGNLQMVFQVTAMEMFIVPSAHDPHVGQGDPRSPEEAMAEYEHADAEGQNDFYHRQHAQHAQYGQGGDYSEEGAAEAGDQQYQEGYEYYEEDEANDASSSRHELYDEDYGLDDEDAGPHDEYGEEYGEEEYQEEYQGDYQQYEQDGQAYEEGQQEYDDQQVEGDGSAVDADDNLAEAHPLLGDIPVSMVVELGRVTLTADEVIRLRAGILVELGRSPTDPVDLVVNGKLIARGELVEIEGQLGVKILSLTKGES